MAPPARPVPTMWTVSNMTGSLGAARQSKVTSTSGDDATMIAGFIRHAGGDRPQEALALRPIGDDPAGGRQVGLNAAASGGT